MNAFEQFTVIVGLLAILLEGWDHVRSFIHKLLH